MSRIALLFANGTEECEALIVADILRRAGEDLCIVAVSERVMVTGSHNITIVADECIDEHDFSEDDVLIIPGGMPGTNVIEADESVQRVIDYMVQQQKLLCAICAAPKILGHKGLLANKKACIYPGMDEELYDAKVSHDDVSVDGNFITSRGLGTAIPFALAILERIQDKKSKDEMSSKIVFR